MTNFVCIIPSAFKLKSDPGLRSGEDKRDARFLTDSVLSTAEKMASSAMSMGATTTDLSGVLDPKECFCYRPQRLIFCWNCDFKALGRVSRVCQKHPETSFLHDWAQCPYCRGYTLKEY